MHNIEAPAYLGRDRELVAGPRMDNLVSVHAGTAALTAAAAGRGRRASYQHSGAGRLRPRGERQPVRHRRRRARCSARVLERSVFARGGSYEDRARAFAGTLCLSVRHRPRRPPQLQRAARAGPPPDAQRRPDPQGQRQPALRHRRQRTGRRSPRPASGPGCRGRASCPTTRCPAAPPSGPITAARHGITTVDIGVPILSMHSARELCGAEDPYLLANALTAFLEG